MNALFLQVDPRYPGVIDTVTPYLERALVHGGYKDWNLEHVFDFATKGFVQLWTLIKDNKVFGAGVTTETVYPKRKVVEILLLGTDKHTDIEWSECFEQFKLLCHARGVTTISGTGRRGWCKKLKADYTKTVFEITLGDKK